MVKDGSIENGPGLLGHSFLNVIIRSNFGSITCIAGNRHTFPWYGTFLSHVIVGCAIEVVVRPAEELIFAKRFASLGIIYLELGVRLKQARCH